MLKRIAILMGLIILAILAIGAIIFYSKGESNPDTGNDLLIKTAYLAKSKESYARCYNSINYGTSLIGDVRLKIKGENFNNESITADRLNKIEKSFMDSVKLECQKTVDDYQQAYDKAIKDQEETESASNAFWNFLFGSMNSQLSTQDLSSFEPARARMSITFNDYVFTEQEVKVYFEKELNL